MSLLAATLNLEMVVGLGVALFLVGLFGVAIRRNILIMLLSIEIMLNAANLIFVAFSRVHAELSGQVFVFFSMTVAAAEVAVGLAIVIALYRLRRSVDVDESRDLHEVDYGPVPPLQLEGEDQHHDDDHHDEAPDETPDEPPDDTPRPEEPEPVGAAPGGEA